MLKLYFKKLLFTLLLFAIYILMCGLIMFIWHLLLGELIPEGMQTIIILVLGALILLRIIYKNRCDSKPYKRAFLEEIEHKPVTFLKDFFITIKSKENTIHTLSYITLDLLRTIRIGIISDATFWRVVVVTAALVIIRSLIFTIGNTLIWCAVHRRWLNYLKYSYYISERFD